MHFLLLRKGDVRPVRLSVDYGYGRRDTSVVVHNGLSPFLVLCTRGRERCLGPLLSTSADDSPFIGSSKTHSTPDCEWVVIVSVGVRSAGPVPLPAE